MIAVLVVIMLVLVMLGGAALVAAAMKQRRDRLVLALEPTCLLCGARDVELFVPPDYRCGACGFDTRRAGALSTELETFRALEFALHDLDYAEELLRDAIINNEHALDGGAQPFGGSVAEIAGRLMNAHSHLREIVLDRPRLLDPPIIDLNEESLHALARHRDEVRLVRDETRHAIVAQMSADGTVDTGTLDFEHVVDRDYEGL